MLSRNEENFIWDAILKNKYQSGSNENKIIDHKKILNFAIKNNIEEFPLQIFSQLKINDQQYQEARKIFNHKKLKTLSVFAAAINLFNDYVKNRIDFCSLKGTSYVPYLGIENRNFRDIDVLVSMQDLSRAVDIATQHGFKFENNQKFSKSMAIAHDDVYGIPRLYNENGILLEIHYRISQKATEISCKLSNDILKSKQKITFCDKQLYVPTQELSIIHFLYHATLKGNYDVGLSAIADYFKLMKKYKVDTEKLNLYAKKFNLIGELKSFDNLYLKHQDRKFDQISERNMKKLFLLPIYNKKLLQFDKAKGLNGKIKFLLNHIFVKKTVLARDFNIDNEGSNLIKYYFKRWGRQFTIFLIPFLLYPIERNKVKEKNKLINYFKKQSKY